MIESRLDGPATSIVQSCGSGGEGRGTKAGKLRWLQARLSVERKKRVVV